MIAVMSQEKVAVLSTFSGLVTLDPKHDAMENYRVRVSKGVIGTISYLPLHIFVR